MVKSNPIPVEWVTHKLENKYITEVIPQEYELLSPKSGSPTCGYGIGRRSSENIWLWKPVASNRKDFTEPREKETPLLEGTQGLVCTRTQEKVSDFIGAWVRPSCGSWRVSWGGGMELWLTVGTRAVAAVVPGKANWCELSWRPPYWQYLSILTGWPHLTPLCSSAGMPHLDNKQGGKHSPTHHQTDCLKSFWAHSYL